MISLYGNVGSLFNILGKAGKVIQQAKTYQTAQQTNLTNQTTGLTGQLQGQTDIEAIVGDDYINQLNVVTPAGSLMQQVAAATINRLVFLDNPQPNQTLTQGNTLASINEVIRQMKLQGATVLAMTITATPGSFIGTGTGAITTSVRRPLDGLVLENAYGETLTLSCASDSYSGGATAYNESFTLTGGGIQSNPFAFNWPLGSNSSAQLSAIDGNSDNSSGNLLTNSSFGDTGSSVLSNWTLTAGTVSTNFFAETSLVLRGTSALRVLGANGTQVIWQQQLNNGATGTSGALSANTQYSFNVFLRRDGTAAGAGTLQIALVDQNGNIINDQAGTQNVTTVDLTALNTIYTGFNFNVRTPTILPAQQWLRFWTTVPITNGRSFYVDCASLGAMTQAYTSGPFAAVHSGASAFVEGDYAFITITNSRGAGGSLSSWQSLMSQLFYNLVYSNEILLPSAAAPSVSDTLIG